MDLPVSAESIHGVSMDQEFFRNEDLRKEKLFVAWNKYLDEYHNRVVQARFDEIYEGLGIVLGLSENHFGVELADGRKIRNLSASSQIIKQSRQEDLMYLILGSKGGIWKPLEVISVGSLQTLTQEKENPSAIHLTYNPRLIDSSESKDKSSGLWSSRQLN